MVRRRAWLLVVATAACSAAEVTVLRLADVPLLSAETFGNAFPLVNLATVVGALVGAVILARYPGHRIGWLFAWGQLGVAAGLLLRAVADTVNSGRLAGPPALGRVADVSAVLLGSQFALLLLAVLLFLAPDGRLLSPRWRPWLVGSLLAEGVAVVGVLLFVAAGGGTAAEVVLGAGQIGVFTGLAAAVVSLVARLLRATGVVRQQLRWIVAAAALLASAPAAAVVTTALGLGTPAWVVAVLHVGYLAVPVATGFAVLRYRLYDIDRLIGGSVVLAVLAAFASVGYVLVVTLAGFWLPGPDARPWLSLAVFVAVVLALQPVRRAARRLAGRLVYGRQAMSYAALARFSRELVRSTPDRPFLDAVAEAAGRLVGADRATAVLVLPEGGEQRSRWPRTDGGPDRSDTTIVVPVGRPPGELGRLELEVAELATGHARRRELLQALAGRLSEPFAQARLEGELRDRARELDRLNAGLAESRTRLIEARDLSRRQVAARIEADVVAPLRPVADRLVAIEELARTDRTAATVELDEALASTGRAIDQLRQITSTVYSRRLAEYGLAAALSAESRDEITVMVTGSARWSPAVEAVLFACCLDVLRTASGAVEIRLAQTGRTAQLTLRLAGATVDPGWRTFVEERVVVLGGSVVEAGTEVSLRLPTSEDSGPATTP